MGKWVYTFGNGTAEGSAKDRNLLGGKGANLAEMSSHGLPVPPGFTISTELCTAYYDNGSQYPADLQSQVDASVKYIEDQIGNQFGSTENPLLVSVRSGARASMPGMMDTVLNLGLNDETVTALANNSGNERFAYDSYRRFIQMYSDVVLEVDHYHFEELLERKKLDKGVELDTDLDAEDLKSLVAEYKACVAKELGRPFPQNVQEQLWGAISAVFSSWMNTRAITYRKMYDIPQSWGTAVNVQAMVFGNMGQDCATGVAFTRDPSTGENIFFGEYLVNAQGEDVVAGIRTPQQVTIDGKNRQDSELPAMEEVMPAVYHELVETYKILENHYRDMQDIEFTVQNNKLWMLQTRAGKRTGPAAIKIAVDMVNEGLITKEEAIARIEPNSLDQLLHPTLDPNAKTNTIAKGLPASPGAASGTVVFSADEAERLANNGQSVMLVRIETSPEDIHGMHAAQGILTARGGMTSHAAVVARGMGRPCVSGAGDVRISYADKEFTAGGNTIKEGDSITINGSTGEVMLGTVPTIQPKLSDDFAQLMGWADEIRVLKVRTNAETPLDAATAVKFGAEGIGLCRTEHMFFDAERIIAVREMIVAENKEGRKKAIDKLLPFQRGDFKEIFDIMEGLPVTIRLLDPPLHEFLPHTDADMEDVAKAAGVDVSVVKKRAADLKEENPMLGHRGCRLGISYPELYAMQARAIIEAALDVAKSGKSVLPEIMVPLVMNPKELQILKAVINTEIEAVFAERSDTIDYMVGTMIELPRAALQADKIAEDAEFFSFGTNDLTQTTLGISRDDSASFIGDYMDQGIVEKDPFATLDQEGVGELIEIAAQRGRKTRHDIKLGICGEHGGDPASIEFCQRVGLDYVSCSPYRVPIARLAAAQAILNCSEALKEAA
jgi:pyruvate,orthophosphate dikinase